jgi:hypothetical protein
MGASARYNLSAHATLGKRRRGDTLAVELMHCPACALLKFGTASASIVAGRAQRASSRLNIARRIGAGAKQEEIAYAKGSEPPSAPDSAAGGQLARQHGAKLVDRDAVSVPGAP